MRGEKEVYAFFRTSNIHICMLLYKKEGFRNVELCLIFVSEDDRVGCAIG